MKVKALTGILLLAATLVSHAALQYNPWTTSTPAAVSNIVQSIALGVVTNSTNTIIITSTPEDDFTIVQMGDMQKSVLTGNGQAYFTNTINWLIANKALLNLKAVMFPGDLVDVVATEAHWTFSTNQLWRLHLAGIPFYACAGNHDTTGSDHAAWNGHFGTMLAAQSGYTAALSAGDYYGAAWKQTNAGMKQLVIALGYTTSGSDFTNLINFATAQAAQYPDHAAIFLIHAYLSSTGILLDTGDDHYLASYSGKDYWDKALRAIPNAVQVMCGHDWPTNYARAIQTGDAGNRVDASFFNFQDITDGGGAVCAALALESDAEQRAGKRLQHGGFGLPHDQHGQSDDPDLGRGQLSSRGGHADDGDDE